MLSSLQRSCSQVQQRWVFAVMACLAVSNAFSMRICLNIAITEMVRGKVSSNLTNSDDTCPEPESINFSSENSGTYDWDEHTQGIILSSFFWGYIFTQIPGGILADKYGGKYTLGLGIFSTAIFTLLTPIVVQTYDALGLIVLRVLMGLGEGTTFPAANALVAQWAPPDQRSTISTIVMSGMQMGTILGTALSGVLIQHSSIGWSIVFYFFGAFGVLWFFAWVVLCYSNPDSHPFISEKEKKYLRNKMNEHTHKEIGPTPWRHIITSAPVIVLLFAKLGENFGFQTMVTDLPKYMKSVLKFSIQANGFLSSLPTIAMWFSGLASSWLVDQLIKKEKLSTTKLRKICAAIASLGPAIFLVAASYAGCDGTVVVTLFTIGMGLMGLMYPSTIVNALDLSPNYSGSLTAVTMTIVAVAGIVAPYVIGRITPNQTLLEWRIVFWMTFVIYILTAAIYVIWADGEVQEWNNPDFRKDKAIEPGKRQPDTPETYLSKPDQL